MRTEIGKPIIEVFKDTHSVSVETTLSLKRREWAFTVGDLIREKDNQMFREFGKMVVFAAGFEAAAIQGLNQIINGFNHTDVMEMAQGVGVVALASALIPISWHFLNETKITREERKKIEEQQKGKN